MNHYFIWQRYCADFNKDNLSKVFIFLISFIYFVNSSIVKAKYEKGKFSVKPSGPYIFSLDRIFYGRPEILVLYFIKIFLISSRFNSFHQNWINFTKIFLITPRVLNIIWQCKKYISGITRRFRAMIRIRRCSIIK